MHLTIKKMVDDLKESPYIALDTETTGLHFSDVPFSIQLKTKNHSLYINMNDLAEIDDPMMMKPLLGLDVTWFMHNATYDLCMLRKIGLRVGGTIHCTQSMARLIHNNHFPPKYDLTSVAVRYGLEPKDDEVKKYIRKHKCKYEEVPHEMMVKYGMKDVELTYEIGMRQLKDLKIDSLYYNETRFTRVCEELEWQGIPVDVDYCKEALAYHTDIRDRALATFRSETGTEFLDSTREFAKIIPDQYANKTKKGNMSFDKEALASCPLPIARTIETIREQNNLIKNFYENILRNQIGGTVHPSVKRASTVTARLSYSEPNLQNFPKDEDWQGKKYLVRQAVVPPEGFELVAIDFDQQEFRVLLDYAGEKAVIDQINGGEDVHQATANMVGVDRKTAKGVGFGLLYGIGLDQFSKILGKTKDETRALRNRFFSRLPKVKHLVEQIKYVAETRGYIKNWAGRHYVLDDPRFSYRMVNYLIQGGCADIMRYALVHCWNHSTPDLYPLISVHDEIVFAKRIGTSDRGINQMRELMESVYIPQNGVKLTTSVERSTKSWGQKDMEEVCTK